MTGFLQFSFEILWFLCFLGFLSFVVYFKRWPLERGSGAHSMTHSCSDGFDGGIEWLFQLKDNEEIEIVFQWFQVQCKMRRMHETCKSNDEADEHKEA